MATTIALASCNTITLAAANAVYTVNSPAGQCNILNIGPGTLWYRNDGKPAAADSPQCAQLPAGMADLGVAFHARVSLVADTDDTVVSIRCY